MKIPAWGQEMKAELLQAQQEHTARLDRRFEEWREELRKRDDERDEERRKRDQERDEELRKRDEETRRHFDIRFESLRNDMKAFREGSGSHENENLKQRVEHVEEEHAVLKFTMSSVVARVNALEAKNIS